MTNQQKHIISQYIVIFFFSSRRRHTRSYGDWSSDVCSSDLVVQVLDRERDAVERAARLAPHERLLGLARRRQGLVGRERAERVDHRVEALDAVERRMGQLDRRELLRADQRDQLGRRGEREVGGRHGRLPRYFFEISQCPSARCGKPERSNVSTASSAEQTSGSPCRLNEVLSTAPIPVRRSNSRMTR